MSSSLQVRSRHAKLMGLWAVLGLLACKDVAPLGRDASAPQHDASAQHDASTKHDASMPVDAADGESDAGSEGAPDARVDAQTGDDGAVGSAIMLSGAAEKGPLVLGSSVSVSAVDHAGVPTGLVFNTETTDDLGHFELPVQHHGIVALEANGYYFNEVTGQLSGAPITLRGFYELSHDSGQTANINVLTHLTNRRVRALLQNGKTLAQAVAQAESELVATLGIGSSVSGAGTSLDIANSAYLFALSAVTAQAALISGGSNGADAALQELLNKIAVDLEDDGAVSASFHDALIAAEDALDVESVTDNLATRLGTTVPDLNGQLDSDLDGLLNADDNCPNVANPGQIDSNGDGVGDKCCGNGAIEGEEECDNGGLNGATNGCTPVCTAHRCGDGYAYSGSEACDDGNSTNGDACDNDCTLPHCGDGAINGSEACDDGNQDNGDGCDINCTVSACGNGAQAPNEQCDDGNLIDADGCDADCTNSAWLIEITNASVPMKLRNNAELLVRVSSVTDGQATPVEVKSVSAEAAGLTAPFDFESGLIHFGFLALGNMDAGPAELVVTATLLDDSTVERAFPFIFDPTVTTTPELGAVTPNAVSAGSASFTIEFSLPPHNSSPPNYVDDPFVPGSVAYFDDTALETTVTTVHSAHAVVPAELVAAPGRHSITLRNPGDSGAVSNALSFQVSDHVPTKGAWSIVESPAGWSSQRLSLTLSDGMVLLVGPAGAISAEKSELFDPAGGHWAASTSLNIARYDGSKVILLGNGQVLVAGASQDPDKPNQGPSAETREPDTQSWTLTGAMVEHRRRFGMSLLQDGTVLASGGFLRGYISPDLDDDLRSAERYDPNTRAWTAVHSMVVPRELHTQTTLLDGKVLVTGGLMEEGYQTTHRSYTTLGSTEVYDLVSDQWMGGGDLLTPRSGHIAIALPNGKALVLGGSAGGPELYDPNTMEWTAAGQAASLYSIKAAVLLPSGLVIAVGNGIDGPFSAAQYDPETDFWYHATPMTSAGIAFSLIVLSSGKVLAITDADAQIFDPTVP